MMVQSSLKTIFKLFFEAGYQAVLLYRISRWFYLRKGGRLLSHAFARFNLLFTGADIHPSSDLGAGLIIPHPSGIVIGGDTKMGKDCVVMHSVTLGALEYGLRGERHPRIGNRVKIYCHAKILGPIVIGDDSVIAAGAIVTKNIPQGCLAINVNEIRQKPSEDRVCSS